MALYNAADVILLEKNYLRFLPWIKNHPNLANYSDTTCCPKCQSKSLQRRGYAIANSTKYIRIWCKDCGGWSRATLNEKENRPIISI